MLLLLALLAVQCMSEWACGKNEYYYDKGKYVCYADDCSIGGWWGSLEDAEKLCAKCNCAALHDLGYDNRWWRVCKTVYKGEGAQVKFCGEVTESPTLPTETTLEPTLATLEPTETTLEPTEATLEPSEATLEPTMATPATPEPTEEDPWTAENTFNRCPNKFKLSRWGNFGRKGIEDCKKKCMKRKGCVAISIKEENNSCTGFSACPYFEDTRTAGKGNDGFTNVRLKPDPAPTVETFSAVAFSQPRENRASWNVGERALGFLACVGLFYVATVGLNLLCNLNKPDSTYLEVDQDL